MNERQNWTLSKLMLEQAVKTALKREATQKNRQVVGKLAYGVPNLVKLQNKNKQVIANIRRNYQRYKPFNLRSYEEAVNAARTGNVRGVKAFLSLGHHVNATSNDVSIPRTTLLKEAAKFGQDNVIKLLLKRGARINQGNIDNTTPLMWSLIQMHPKTANLLLRSGSRTTLKNRRGRTAASIAANMERSDFPRYRKLLLKIRKYANSENMKKSRLRIGRSMR